MRRALAAAALVLAAALAGPAEAHRLKLFATIEAGEVRGYGFFAGGRRVGGAAWRAEDGAGRALAEGVTDAEGAFAFAAPASGPVRLIVDASEGHVAEVTLGAERFGAPVGAAGSPSLFPAEAAAPPAPPDDDALAALVERAVDAAVARQLRPLIEAQEAAEARVRFNDVAGGVGMIVGLAGVALWARGRRS